MEVYAPAETLAQQPCQGNLTPARAQATGSGRERHDFVRYRPEFIAGSSNTPLAGFQISLISGDAL